MIVDFFLILVWVVIGAGALAILGFLCEWYLTRDVIRPKRSERK